MIGRRYSHRSSDRSASTITPRCRGFPLRFLVGDGRAYHSYLRPRLLPPCHFYPSFSYSSAYSHCSALVPLDGHPRRTASARLFRLVRHRQYCWSTLLSDRKSTRLNSSHVAISYAVFCLKKKKNNSFPFLACVASVIS